MQRFLLSILFTLLLILGQVSVANASALSEQELTRLLTHPLRAAEDNNRDEARQPAKVMAFTGITPGSHVLDLFAGAGWYSELFSMAVGENGKVYAQNDEVIWRFAEKGMSERSKNNRLANVVRFDGVAISAIDIPDNSLDLVFTALNYHDLFFTYTLRDGKRSEVRKEIVDHKAALARIKKAMKDQGVFVIIDHVAKPGSGYEVANTLHRIDPNIVKYQMDEAGFKLIEEAFYLRNPEDELGTGVFDTSVRGKTDRFIYKFSKK